MNRDRPRNGWNGRPKPPRSGWGRSAPTAILPAEQPGGPPPGNDRAPGNRPLAPLPGNRPLAP
ncbi:MAG: hypothetical protein ACR2G2_16295, partial [Pseudonocardia sp.]